MLLYDEVIHRIEDAPSGLAYVMRKHDAVFYLERGNEYVIHVPKCTRSGKPDHRVYEDWRIGKERVELMTNDLDQGMPPMRFDAQPPKKRELAPSRKHYVKRIR